MKQNTDRISTNWNAHPLTSMLTEFSFLQALTANNLNPTLTEGEGDNIPGSVPLTYFPDCTLQKITSQK